MKRSLPVEVVVSSAADAAVAAEGGADRVELCMHLEVGGLSVSTAAVRAACLEGLPVRALVRPREGGFVYSRSERALIVCEAQNVLEAGAERAVVGGLTADGRIDERLVAALLDVLPADRLVFHRAIDRAADYEAALKQLRGLGLSEVLTSGGAARAIDGLSLLKSAAQSGLSVIAGAGVLPVHVPDLSASGAHVIHASCRELAPNANPPSYVDLTRVQALVAAARLERL